MRVCTICNLVFDNAKVYSNHVRWNHKQKIQYCCFCGKLVKCGLVYHESHCKNNPINSNSTSCNFCGKLISVRTYKKIYCNQSCAAKHRNYNRVLTPRKEYTRYCDRCGVSIIAKNKSKKYCTSCYIKAPISNNSRNSSVNIKDYKCVICNKVFSHKNTYTYIVQTCGDVCYRKLLSLNSKKNPNCGGETNYRKYIYKDIHMDSTWEVDIAKWLDLNDIEWQRTRKLMFLWTDKTGSKRRYYPDFYLPKYNIYLDPKNPYLQQKDREKIDAVIKENNIILWMGTKDNILARLAELV